MDTKTIDIELDAYERLRSVQRPGESLSEAIRRAHFPIRPPTGADLLRYIREGGSGIPESELDVIEKAADADPIPDDPWTQS